MDVHVHVQGVSVLTLCDLYVRRQALQLQFPLQKGHPAAMSFSERSGYLFHHQKNGQHHHLQHFVLQQLKEPRP
jgi:hypothetical protein